MTELTLYLWPGFIAELNTTTHTFMAWELLSASECKYRPDILAPPFDCMDVWNTTVKEPYKPLQLQPHLTQC
jgi:hypothetical protein